MQINWSEQSRNDLHAIITYVGVNFGRRKAEEVLADIRSQADLLKTFPNPFNVYGLGFKGADATENRCPLNFKV